jgi:predicted AAA+ superfamily ATPase
VQVYLKEEVLVEQLVRNLIPFKGFLEVSAQMSSERINYEKIGRDIGVDNKTVQSYFDILEETFLGVRLPAFHRSVRKSQLMQPKFYWFDLGVQRFLSGAARSPLVPGTSAYGEAFETFLINEIHRYNLDMELDYKLSYLQTKNGPEVDLILSRGKESIALEIKSSKRVDIADVNKFEALAADIPGVKKMIFLSQDMKGQQRIGNVKCIPWTQVFQEL